MQKHLLIDLFCNNIRPTNKQHTVGFCWSRLTTNNEHTTTSYTSPASPEYIYIIAIQMLKTRQQKCYTTDNTWSSQEFHIYENNLEAYQTAFTATHRNYKA